MKNLIIITFPLLFLSFMGREIADTKATGKPANIITTWTGMGIFAFIFVMALVLQRL